MFRQGVRTLTSDKNTKTTLDQSQNDKQKSSPSKAVPGQHTAALLEKQPASDQPGSSSKVSFSGQSLEDNEERDHTG
jgi:hypothetical protein